MGPVNYVSAKKEKKATDAKPVEAKDKPTEATTKPDETPDPESNDTKKKESSDDKPVENKETTNSEGSEYFINPTGQE